MIRTANFTNQRAGRQFARLQRRFVASRGFSPRGLSPFPLPSETTGVRHSEPEEPVLDENRQG